MLNRNWTHKFLIAGLSFALVAGCTAEPSDDADVPLASALGNGSGNGNVSGNQDDDADVAFGRLLFDSPPDVGNGTACLNCHLVATGTISPEDVQALNGTGPLFQHDRQDFDGSTRGRTLGTFVDFVANATIMVGIGVPDNVVVDKNPSISKMFFRRTVPSNINIGTNDDVVMWDGREPSLEQQAVDATNGHAQAVLTAEQELERRTFIPIFEREDSERSFSSSAMEDFVKKGKLPKLPKVPGAVFFEPGGACAACHGGPVLNTTLDGERFANNGSSAANALGNEVNSYVFDGTVTITSSDPGRALITGVVADVDKFKIPSLFNVKNTAPYFHDGSAKTLEEAVRHYDDNGIVQLSEADIADIIEFLQALE